MGRPKGSTKENGLVHSVQATVSADQVKALIVIAGERKCSMAYVVRLAIDDFIAKEVKRK